MRKATSGRFNFYHIGDTCIRANVHGAEVIDAPPKGLKFHEVQEAPKHVHFLSTCKEVTNAEGLDMIGRRMLSNGAFAYTRPGSLVELVIDSKLEVRKVWDGWGWEEANVASLSDEEFNLAHHPEVGSLVFNSMGRVARILKIDKGPLLAHIDHENYPMHFAQLERIVPGSKVRTFPEGRFVKVDPHTDSHIITKDHAFTYNEIASNKMVFAGDTLAGGSIYKGDPSITKVAYSSGPRRVYGGKWIHYMHDVYIDMNANQAKADSAIGNLASYVPTHSEWMALVKGSHLPPTKSMPPVKAETQRGRLQEALKKFTIDMINENDFIAARQSLNLLIEGNK